MKRQAYVHADYWKSGRAQRMKQEELGAMTSASKRGRAVRYSIAVFLLFVHGLVTRADGASDPSANNFRAAHGEDFTKRPALKRPHSLLNAAQTWRSRTELGLHATYREVDGKRRYGYRDLDSRRVVVEQRFDGVHDTFSEGLGGFRLDGAWGFVNAQDEIVIEPQFQIAHPFSEGFAVVQIGDRFAFVGRDGEILKSGTFEAVRDFSEGLAGVQIEGKWGFIDPSGEFAIPPQFNGVGFFSEGLASFTDESAERFSNMGYIDRNGNIAIQPRFSGAGYFSEGLAPVRIGDRWDYDILIRGPLGYIDRTGELVISPKFFSADPFLEGRAAVQLREPDGSPGLWGFIRPDETWALTPRFNLRPTGYSSGIAAHHDDQTRRWINLEGESVPRPKGR